MKRVRVEVNDKMQKGYVYWRTKPMGHGFRRDFKPDLTPKQMLALGVFGGKYMTDCRKEFPASWFEKAKFLRDRHTSLSQLFRSQRVAAAFGLAGKRVDLRGGSARLVSMVLPVLFRTSLHR